MDKVAHIVVDPSLKKGNVIWDKPEYLKRYLDCLAMANHTGKVLQVGNQYLDLKTGEIGLTPGLFSELWGCSISAVKRFFDLLEDLGVGERVSERVSGRVGVFYFVAFGEMEADFQDSLKIRERVSERVSERVGVFLLPIIKRKKESKPKKKRKHSANEPTQDTPETTPAKSFKQWTPEDFKDSIRTANESIGLSPEDLHDFYDYWTEPSASGKQRYHRENTWDTQRRLRTWSRNLQTNFKR